MVIMNDGGSDAMTTTATDIRSRVAKGAAVLDRIRPGWALQIWAPGLDISDCMDCMLGRLYGSFEEGIRSIPEIGYSAADYGFVSTQGTNEEWESESYSLTLEWRRVIAERRAASSESTQ